jgi:alkanesulfonate monooxygenase SsuD/methylene tetrahydromethanopterin reductase-like flavin-dependent oxidoreductase (luciferase family)
MKYGLSLPNRGPYGDINLLVELAQLAEESGWDGFFIWDHYASGVAPHVDPWICMAAVACNKNKMRLGIHITPISRRRPWKVVREIVSLDHLSNGRMVLGAGLGDFNQKEFKAFGEVSDPRTRGEMLSEGLEIITGLQSGEPFSYDGKHYRFPKTVFKPKPVQTPRVPVWVAGQWPNKPPFRRAARWDGVVPLIRGRGKADFLTPDEIREIIEYIWKYRKIDTPFDVCLSGITPGKKLADDRAIVSPYKGAGVTWWIDFVYSGTGSVKRNKARIKFGPPR